MTIFSSCAVTSRLMLMLAMLVGMSSMHCASNRISTVETLEYVQLSGYRKIDTWPNVYVREATGWRPVNQSLPQEGYYLDDEFYPYSMSCVVTCVAIEAPLAVRLIEYVKTGTKKVPPGSEYDPGTLVPTFETVALQGRLRIVMEYSDDSNCENKKIYSSVIDR